MPIGPVELHGMVARTQDFQNFKTAEDNKPILENMYSGERLDRKAEEKSTNVQQKDNAGLSGDAKHSKNEYGGDGGKNRKKKEDGKVINKSVHSFDIKI